MIRITKPLRNWPEEKPIIIKDGPKARFNGRTRLSDLPEISEELWLATMTILNDLKINTINDFNYRSHELEVHDEITTEQLAIIYHAVREYTLNSDRLPGE